MSWNISSEEKLREFGFTDNDSRRWYYAEYVDLLTIGNICISVTIPKDDPSKGVVDIINQKTRSKFDAIGSLPKKIVSDKVKDLLERLTEQGILLMP